MLFRSVFSGGLAGIAAGVIFLGLGSRLAMRVVTLLNSDARGTLTDAEQVVGAVTFGGTVALVIFIGLIGGLLSGVFWVVIREHLPDALLPRTALAGAIAMLVGSFFVIEASNTDFMLFTPVAFNVAMFMLLIGLSGPATAIGDSVLQHRLPTGAQAGIAYGLLAGIVAIPAVMTIVSAYFVEGAFVHNPPRAVGVFLGVAVVGTLLTWARYTPWRMPLSIKLGRWTGTFGLGGMLVFGRLQLMSELSDIF
jgi:hypothetical protein